jgi:hypothetical protein
MLNRLARTLLWLATIAKIIFHPVASEKDCINTLTLAFLFPGSPFAVPH